MTPFMVFLILALFEMGQIFYAYIAMVSAARDGGIYASMNTVLSTECPSPLPQVGSSGYAGMTEKCKIFADRVSGDLVAAFLDSYSLTIARPILGTETKNGITFNNITVTISYQLRTFSSDMAMPFFGRMGLPNFYQLVYSFGMQARDVP